MIKYHAVRTYIGLDVGSVYVKACLISANGDLISKSCSRITSDTVDAVNRAVILLENAGNAHGIGISGSGRTVFNYLDIPLFTSPLALIAGIIDKNPSARSIIQLGGSSSLVIHLEDGLKKPWKVYTNPLCAAGTGRFIEQQAYRLKISLDEFSRLALAHDGTTPRIATRCSVFAKSDLIHLQQKGVPLSSMLYSLCQSVARMATSLFPGKIEEPIFLAGGLAKSQAIQKAIEESLTEKNGEQTNVHVIPDAEFAEAFGAALLSREKEAFVPSFPLAGITTPKYYRLPPLARSVEEAPPSAASNLETAKDAHLGIDVGSTSTKAVLLDSEGKQLLAKNYIMTSGRPIEAIRQVFCNLVSMGAEKLNIKSVGVTGSGRYLVGSFVGANLVKNEITAQTRGAAEIDPDSDIIEIGGQDSKLVLKRNGIVVDYQMNKACAAGTGSFIDELAEMLGIKVTNGEFAKLAFQAPYTIDLGTRCAAFIGQSISLAQQEGIPKDVIAASLSLAIAQNYLSKVVGYRKLGPKVILTGAVFYNESVVEAFRAQLGDRQVSVATHREVSGAIGVALLAREQQGIAPSLFKGFQQVIDQQCQLKTHVCQSCDNNCTITRMLLGENNSTFYGSRCDKYDSIRGTKKLPTAFDDREKLLFAEYSNKSESGPIVGIPRALLTFDFAPLMIAFINALNARVLLSGKTTSQIIEKSTELAHSDSCFPLKLMHGHVDSLKKACDYILFPASIRLGQKEGDHNQKYSCPLVQASPYIIREVLSLGSKIITPILDFSMGDKTVIDSLATAATQMGFSREKGKVAAQLAITAQNSFISARKKAGEKALDISHRAGKIGVVILSRAYMAQDSGANLGIAETLANLGVDPIPLDFLPIESINVEEYSDRPYWSYEGKLIAAAAIIAKTSNLFGLVISNFGCGPNSFITPILEDIMGTKPLGQLEIDEHAAEAGLVTRLEAFVDTITGFSCAKQAGTPQLIQRRYSTSISSTAKTLVLPRMAPFIDTLAATAETIGCRALVLPDPNEQSLLLANQVTSGTECLPYRVTLGDYMRFFKETPKDQHDVLLLMASSYGPCRLGKYALEQNHALKKLGYPISVHSTVSNSAYRDINLGPSLIRYGLSSIFAVDWLERLLWRTRPYERSKGKAIALFHEYLGQLTEACRHQQNLAPILRKASDAFINARDHSIPRRPLVGINGEIYLRTNTFSNQNLVEECEASGLEVVVSPMSEWIKYTSYRNLEDHLRFKRLRKVPASFLKHQIVLHDDNKFMKAVKKAVDLHHEPSISDILNQTKRFLSPRCGSEAVLSIGGGVEWLSSPHFAGVISVMPHGCMPGGIVAAMAEHISMPYNKPWISLTYDGILENNNKTKIINFAELIRYCHKS